jgi:hypothetical protein
MDDFRPCLVRWLIQLAYTLICSAIIIDDPHYSRLTNNSGEEDLTRPHFYMKINNTYLRRRDLAEA